jgi:hypothetical protein
MDNLNEIINKMKEVGQISFEKPRTLLFITKCKAKESHEKTLSRTLIEGAKLYHKVKIKTLGVN